MFKYLLRFSSFMIVKHNFTCSLCSKQKTCFVFDEFSMLVAVCRDCYDDLVENILTFEEDIDVCSFCEQNALVKKINAEFPTFYGDVFICSECFTKFQFLVDQG